MNPNGCIVIKLPSVVMEIFVSQIKFTIHLNFRNIPFSAPPSFMFRTP
jgi:hypothetical protein